MSSSPLVIGDREIRRGTRKEFELPLGRLPSGAATALPVAALSGRRQGPTVWLSAAIHGDELNGVEIIREVLAHLRATSLRGTVLAVPIVNVFGFATGDRYMPDRRDLNRSFPGSSRGSLTARLAHLFMTEIVAHCDYGIDLHTGSDGRSNHPHVRADLEDPRVVELAEAFAPPVLLHARATAGTLRRAAARADKPYLLFEAGEANRFDRASIDTGVKGVLRVLGHLGMIEPPAGRRPRTIRAQESSWTRASGSGLARVLVELGAQVDAKDPVAVISNAFGRRERRVRARTRGVVIARTEQPVVHRGDALVNVATLED